MVISSTRILESKNVLLTLYNKNASEYNENNNRYVEELSKGKRRTATQKMTSYWLWKKSQIFVGNT